MIGKRSSIQLQHSANLRGWRCVCVCLFVYACVCMRICVSVCMHVCVWACVSPGYHIVEHCGLVHSLIVSQTFFLLCWGWSETLQDGRSPGTGLGSPALAVE